MKGLLSKTLILGTVLMFASTAAMATETGTKKTSKHTIKVASASTHHGKWTCKTNASSATNTAGEKADKTMASNARAASSAFNYALENCRDCTEITCSVESKTAENNNPAANKTVDNKTAENNVGTENNTVNQE